jgi:hypothetical protein
MNVEKIAKTCHEVNRAYCAGLGDDSQLSWDQAPQWQRDSAIDGVNFHLNDPELGPDASHNVWMAHKIADGWEWGEVKDAGKKTHPCIVPFGDLPIEQQIKDTLFAHVDCGMRAQYEVGS